MLIINNGVPKSGSDWVQRVLQKMLAPAAPSEYWRNDWVNPSVDHDRLQAYVASGEWRPGPTLIKLHLINDSGFFYLHKDEVRVIVSYRDLTASVMSLYLDHLQTLRQNPAARENFALRDAWFRNQGLVFARRALTHRLSWRWLPNTLMLSHDDMLDDRAAAVTSIANHLRIPISHHDATAIAGSGPDSSPIGSYQTTPPPDGDLVKIPDDVRQTLNRMEQSDAGSKVSA